MHTHPTSYGHEFSCQPLPTWFDWSHKGLSRIDVIYKIPFFDPSTTRYSNISFRPPPSRRHLSSKNKCLEKNGSFFSSFFPTQNFPSTISLQKKWRHLSGTPPHVILTSSLVTHTIGFFASYFEIQIWQFFQNDCQIANYHIYVFSK